MCECVYEWVCMSTCLCMCLCELEWVCVGVWVLVPAFIQCYHDLPYAWASLGQLCMGMCIMTCHVPGPVLGSYVCK